MPKLDPNGTFKREKEMIAHLADNLHLIEPDLMLCGQGVEFPLFDYYIGTSPRIDIIAFDRDGHFVIVECKVEHGFPAALGQLAAYYQWVKENSSYAPKVRAFLVCKKASPMVWYAIKQMPAIPFTICEYRGRNEIVRLEPPAEPVPLSPPKTTSFLL